MEVIQSDHSYQFALSTHTRSGIKLKQDLVWVSPHLQAGEPPMTTKLEWIPISMPIHKDAMHQTSPRDSTWWNEGPRRDTISEYASISPPLIHRLILYEMNLISNAIKPYSWLINWYIISLQSKLQKNSALIIENHHPNVDNS